MSDRYSIHHMSLASWNIETRRSWEIGKLARDAGAIWAHSAGEGYDFLNYSGKRSPEGLGQLAEEAHQAKLDGLSLWSMGAGFGRAHLAMLRRVPLRYLAIGSADLQDEDHEPLGALGSLEVLSLTGSWTGDRALPLLAPLTGLRWLELGNTNVTSEGLHHLAPLTKLEGLDLCAGSSRQGQSGPHLNDDAVPALLALKGLRVLDLYNSALSSEGLARLLAGLPALERVNLHGYRLSPRVIGSLLAMPSLRFLDLFHQADDAVVSALAAHPGIEGLDLLGCKGVSDVGVAALARLPRLRYLQLYETGVSARVLDLLAHSEIRFLGLAWAPLTDEHIPKLAAIRSLEWVDLRRTQVQPEGLERLRALRPDIQLFRLGCVSFCRAALDLVQIGRGEQHCWKKKGVRAKI